MKKSLRYFLIVLPILLSSCFEIVQEVNISKNGNGSYILTMNFSESKSKLNSLIQKDTLIQGRKIPGKDALAKGLDSLQILLEQCEGISNVSIQKDLSEFIFKVKMDFKSIQQLNESFPTIHKQMNNAGQDLEFESPLSYSQGVFYYKDNQKSSSADSVQRMINLFKSARITNIFRCTDGTIQAYSNKNYNVSPNKKALMIRGTLGEFYSKSKSITNTITLN